MKYCNVILQYKRRFQQVIQKYDHFIHHFAWHISLQGLLRLQSLFRELGERHMRNDVIIRSHRITNLFDSYELLRSVDRQELNCSSLYPCPCPRPIILDLSTVAAFNETRKQVIERLGKELYTCICLSSSHSCESNISILKLMYFITLIWNMI